MALPWDSAYARALTGGPNGIPLSDQIAALTADALHLWLYANGDPKTRGAAPAPVLGQLMGQEPPAPTNRTRRSPAELAAALREQEANRQPD